MDTDNGSHTRNYAKETITNNNACINIKYFKNKQGNGKYNLLYININSLRYKLFELEAQIKLYNNNNTILHFIALTEVRIYDYETGFFNLPNYNVHFSTRSDGDGGCALFIHNSLNCELISADSTHNIDSVMVKIIDLNLFIIVIYKQPTVSFNLFSEIINRLVCTGNRMILVGDANIDLLTSANHTRTYINYLLENGLHILNKITNKFATRVAHRNRHNVLSTSKTIIDHVISNIIDSNFKFYLNDNPLSDHREIMLSFSKNDSINFITKETMKTFSRLNFANYNDMIQSSLPDLNTMDNFGDLYDKLEMCKTNNTQTFTVKEMGNPFKPWINDRFLNLISQKKRYYVLLKKSPSNEYLQMRYKSLCELINTQKLILRSNHYSTIINANANKPKMLWKEINHALFNKTPNNISINAIKLNNHVIKEKLAISKEFNYYFRDIGRELHDQIVHNYPNSSTLITVNSCVNSLYLIPTTDEEICMYIDALKPGNNIFDCISANSLKKHK